MAWKAARKRELVTIGFSFSKMVIGMVFDVWKKWQEKAGAQQFS